MDQNGRGRREKHTNKILTIEISLKSRGNLLNSQTIDIGFH